MNTDEFQTARIAELECKLQSAEARAMRAEYKLGLIRRAIEPGLPNSELFDILLKETNAAKRNTTD